MKTKIALSLAALMSASLLASPAWAQVSVDVGGNAGVGADASAGGSGAGTTGGTSADTDVQVRTGAQVEADVDAGTTAAVGGSFDSAISAIGNNSTTAGSISSMSNVRLVKVVRISDLEGADMDALLSAETENSASIDELQSSIEGNATVMAALEAEAVDPENVVAAEVAADGSLTVYVK